MNSIVFEKSEIITIIKGILGELESESQIEEEFYLPNPIEKKIDGFSSNERENFFNICEEIAKSILELKTGELNEINMIHNEIIYLAEEKLYEYMDNNN